MNETTDKNAPFEEIKKILKNRAKRNFDLALGNFSIGKLVHEICSGKDEGAVAELAKSLSGEGARVSEGFLYDTWRVYRSIGNEGTLYGIRKKLNGNLSWGFLLDHCTKAPEGDTYEARLYWEGALSRIENALSDAEAIAEKRDLLPGEIREQVEGLFMSPGIQEYASRNVEPMEGDLRFALMNDWQITEREMCGKTYRFDPVTGLNVRLLDKSACVEKAVDTAIRQNCRFTVYPGDVMDNARPWPNEEAVMLKHTVRLAKHMPVIVFPGNHDLPRNPQDHSALEFLRDRENIYVIDQPTILYLMGKEIHTKEPPGWPRKDCAKIFIMPFPSRSPKTAELQRKTMAEINAAISASMEAHISGWALEDIDKRVPNLFFGHFTVPEALGVVESMVEFDPSVRLAYLRPFDFVGLGHIHRYQRIGDCEVYYSGSGDRIDHGEENDTKGFLITTMEGRTPHTEFVELPARPFATLRPEFFEEEGWQGRLDDRTIYRVKGIVSKERYGEITKKIRDIQANLVNNLTVESETRVRDVEMTEALTEQQALERYLSEHLAVDEAFKSDVIRLFNSLRITEEQQ